MNHKYLTKWQGMKNRKRNNTVTPYKYSRVEQLDKDNVAWCYYM